MMQSMMDDEKAAGLTRRHGGPRQTSVSFGDARTIEPQYLGPSSESVVSGVSSSRVSGTSSSKSYIRPYFRSRMVTKEFIEKPWLDEKKSIWPVIIPYFGICVGFGLMGLQMYLGWASVAKNTYCLVMEDHFDGPTLNTSLWNYEIQLGGFG